MGIFVVVTSTILTSNTRFGGAFSLRNLAYDVGLSIRQAQVYSISVQKSATGIFAGGYGVYFNLSTPTTYLLFADTITANGTYDVGEVITSNEIGRGFHIADICVTPNGGAEDCGISRLDIHFLRPEPDAYIRADELPTVYESGRIILESPRADRVSVIIGVTGGIFVQK